MFFLTQPNHEPEGCPDQAPWHLRQGNPTDSGLALPACGGHRQDSFAGPCLAPFSSSADDVQNRSSFNCGDRIGGLCLAPPEGPAYVALRRGLRRAFPRKWCPASGRLDRSARRGARTRAMGQATKYLLIYVNLHTQSQTKDFKGQRYCLNRSAAAPLGLTV